MTDLVLGLEGKRRLDGFGDNQSIELACPSLDFAILGIASAMVEHQSLPSHDDKSLGTFSVRRCPCRVEAGP